jgi:hypothetical protein
MVVENLEMTANGAFQADQMTSMGTAKQAFYDKFIAELDYIKQMAEIQPIITIKYNFIDSQGQIVGEDHTATFRTFDNDKAYDFMAKYKKREKRCEIRILSINTQDMDFVKSQLEK